MEATKLDGHQDDFQALGVELPFYLKTYPRRWLTLLLVGLTGAFASGPLNSWPTLEPLLIKEGVWAGPNQVASLSSVYSIASGVSMIGAIFAGMLYDSSGPRVTGAVGAFGCVVCLLIMALAVKVQSLNDLLWVFYPLATLFGGVNTLDVYAWLWLLPEDQGTVASISGAIQVLSDSFVLVAVFMNDEYGIPMYGFFILNAVVSVVAAVIAMLFVPDRKKMMEVSSKLAQAQAQAQAQALGQDISYGTEDDSTLLPNEDDTVSDSLNRSVSRLWDACVLIVRVQPTVFLLLFIFFMVFYMFCIYPCLEMYPLYLALVGTQKATELVNLFGGLYAFTGAVLLLVLGRIVDKIGLKRTTFLMAFPIVVNTFLFRVPSVPVQVVAQLLLTFYINSWYVYLPKILVSYAPPELFGNSYGLLATFLGIGQITLTRVGNYASTGLIDLVFHGHVQPVTKYLVVIDGWAVLTMIFLVVVLIYWHYYPIPEAGSTTMAQVREARYGSQAAAAALLPARKIKGGKADASASYSASSPCCGCLPCGRSLPFTVGAV